MLSLFGTFFGLGRARELVRNLVLSLLAFILFFIVFGLFLFTPLLTLNNWFVNNLVLFVGFLAVINLGLIWLGYRYFARSLDKDSFIFDQFIQLLTCYCLTSPVIYIIGTNVSLSLFMRIVFVIILPPVIFYLSRKQKFVQLKSDFATLMINSYLSLIAAIFLYHGILIVFFEQITKVTAG